MPAPALSAADAGPISAGKGGARAMDLGLRQRDGAKQQRRPAGRAGGRELRPAADRPKKQEGERPSLSSIVGDAVHGVLFLALTAAALIHFGQVFEVVAAAVAVLSVMSLKEAWDGLRRYRGK
jgi:hypothetical protein